MVEKKKPVGGKTKSPAAKPKKAAAKAAKPSKAPAAKPAKAAKAAVAPPPAPRPAAPRPKPKPRSAREAEPAARVTGLHDLAPSSGATRSRKRVGRGPGSGSGKTAGRGHKGQKSRSGYRRQRGFEGGQMPLHRRVPKRGFTNVFRVGYDIVNLSDLDDRFEAGAAVTPDSLREKRLAGRRPVKILGDGEIRKALTVTAHKFSASAQEKIQAAGGRCEVIPR